MKSLLPTLWFALLAFSAQAQFDDHLHRVIPDQGPVSGGTVVTIEGEINFTGLADPCTGVFVWVGGQPTFTRNYDETRIVFETPPYTAGTFDITIDICGARATKKNAFTYGERWERVLLPVYLSGDVSGAHGSIWRTELTATASRGRITGEPQIASEVPLTSDHHVPGRMLYLGQGANETRVASFNLRIRDVSREAESAGTELPVVREDNAFGPYETIVLPNVPVGPLYRAKLRVYRIDLGEPGEVQMFVSRSDILLVSPKLALSAEPMTNGFLRYPGYAEFDLDTITNISLFNRVDVAIITPAAGRYWAFVAVTNNETQQITTVTPQ